MHRAKKVRITDLNQHLTCKLCKGYFIDATTIIECLHSFCRSCIVKYLETNKYCPVCDVQVHKTKPLLNIRTDKTLQDIVYKLVPRLFQNEFQRRRDFYMAHPEAKSALEQFGESYQHFVTSDESVSLTMCYYGCKESTRYLRCPAGVSVVHLQKLIRAKYGLSDHHHVDILYNQDCLNSSLTLMDIASAYSWKRKAPMELTYKIYEHAAKRRKLNDGRAVAVVQHNNNNNWKEVQLRISENGEMSITGIQDEALELVNNNNNKYKSEIVTVVESKANKKELPELKYIAKISTSVTNSPVQVVSEQSAPAAAAPTVPQTLSGASCVSLCSAATKTVFSTISSSKCSVSASGDRPAAGEPRAEEKRAEPKVEEAGPQAPADGRKRKMAEAPAGEPQPAKQQKQTILNHSIGLHNLSNNHPLKKHSQMSKASGEGGEKVAAGEAGEPAFPKPSFINRNFAAVPLNRPGTPIAKPASKPCYMPKTVINVPKPGTSSKGEAKAPPGAPPKSEAKPAGPKPEVKAAATPTTTSAGTNTAPSPAKLNIKSKASTPIGYKTLRDPPKSWNSQIAKANLNKPPPDPKYSDLKNVRPAKFFKMRNNLPRYLGNPASGVKPMYQVHVSPEKEKAAPAADAPPACAAAPAKGEIKKHSIVKIDPKTLKPISEKAPETSSLSNSAGDLKINTSSVSIFNPLKLQNSPKGERKSPKSPHSPKPKGAAAAANKRDKISLNFTPSNPFIPNLASPTISPTQFLYPTGPPGFSPYDPRVMAAYHSLLYGQRMTFPPGLGLDLNQRKNFDLAAPASPKVAAMTQPHSPQQPPMKLPEQLSVQSSSRTNSVNFKSQTSTKKSGKESGGKGEKSLKNAVEKLTQNRVKEIKNEAAANNSTSSNSSNNSNSVNVNANKSAEKKTNDDKAAKEAKESKELKEKAKETKEPAKEVKEAEKPAKEAIKPAKEAAKPVKEAAKSAKEAAKPAEPAASDDNQQKEKKEKPEEEKEKGGKGEEPKPSPPGKPEGGEAGEKAPDPGACAKE